jgi:hypothetical protein
MQSLVLWLESTSKEVIMLGYIKPDMSLVEKLPMTQTLLQLASDDIRSGLNLTPSEVASRIDQRLYPDQRLWLQELIQAAASIDNIYSNFGLGYHFDTMMIVLKNELGWRIVTPVACASGKEIDSVTRACVAIPVNIPIENGNGNGANQASLFSGNVMTYLLIGAVALLLLMGRKS